MQALLPGEPAAELHALDHGYHDTQLIVVYASGSSLIILDGPNSVLQTLQPSPPGPITAVRYHPSTGKIAAASHHSVYIFRLTEARKGTPQWLQESLLPHPSPVRTLSFGTSSEDQELLVTTDASIALWPTRAANPRPLWTRDLASPASHAALSPSGALIASVARGGCLVKIWRRVSFEAPVFDYAYLRHPGAVTHVEWRAGEEGDVLFTVCADGRFRVWKMGHTRGEEILGLWAEVDTVGAIQPRHKEERAKRWVFVLDSATVEAAAGCVEEDKDGQARHADEYLQEVASRNPDVLFIADDAGHMSAWGLESVGCKRRFSEPQAPATIFHVNHVEDAAFGFFEGLRPEHDNGRFRVVRLLDSPGEVAILVHHFDGRITWHQAFVRDLLNPSACRDRVRQLSVLTGHSTSIKKVIRTASGNSLISRTEDNKGIIWRRTSNGSLERYSTVDLKEHIHRAVLLRNGDFLVCLHHDKVTLWDCRGFYAEEIGQCKYDLQTKPLCLLQLPEIDSTNSLAHLATVSTDMTGIVWELNLPSRSGTDGASKTSIREFTRFKLDDLDQALYVLPVDPAGAVAVASDFLDIFAYDVAMSYSAKGSLRTYTARIDKAKDTVEFLTTSTVETGIENPSLGSATSIRRAALVDESKLRLTIWDTRSGRLDHDEAFTEAILDLDWASTPDHQSSVLAVGFSREVLVYSQLRYDYVNDSPAWARVKAVRLPDAPLPFPISDSVWMGDGALVVGTGNQLLIAPATIDEKSDVAPELRTLLPHQKVSSLFQLVRRMNGPLPVFHPQFIAQCVLAGKLEAVHKVLLKLLQTLKFYTEGDYLDPLLGFEVEDFVEFDDDSSLTTSKHEVRSFTDDDTSTVTDAVSQSLNDLLVQKSIPQLTSPEQIALVAIIECVATVSTHSRSIDLNASRFLLFWRSSLIRSHQPQSSALHTPESQSSSGISWREVVFAYHSSSQDILTNLVLSSSHNTISWQLARQSRMFTWLTSRETLLQYFEDVAKSAYTASDPRDPVVCSLYYLALKKKQVLIGLWRMATWSREQSATMKLLRNDFSDPRWKTAAQKNAFALMGRRRFEYAAAFFLLADDLKSALGVIANQLEDIHLALAVGRVYGGDTCPEVQDLVRERILGAALQRGDRWMATWGFWFLGERGAAVRALVSPLDALIPAPDSAAPRLEAKSFLNDDPALVILYEQLRSKSLQTLRGAMQVDAGEEGRFVIRTASLLRRMGCDVLALDLVQGWAFLKPEMPQRETVGELPPSPSATRDPRSLLRRRSSLVVDDLGERPRVQRGASGSYQRSALDGFQEAPSMLDGYEEKKVPSMLDDFSFGEKKTAPPSMLDDVAIPPKKDEKEAKKPTTFAEPEANSILDSFDF